MKKIDVAKEVLSGIMDLLDPEEDQVSVVLFSNGACVPKPLGALRCADLGSLQYGIQVPGAAGHIYAAGGRTRCSWAAFPLGWLSMVLQQAPAANELLRHTKWKRTPILHPSPCLQRDVTDTAGTNLAAGLDAATEVLTRCEACTSASLEDVETRIITITDAQVTERMRPSGGREWAAWGPGGACLRRCRWWGGPGRRGRPGRAEGVPS